MSMQPDVWLADVAGLERWLADLAPGEPIALDTEFERTDTFFPKPGLVQLASAHSAHLVEPEVAAASTDFVAWLGADRNPKLLYAMSEDLDLIRHWLGAEIVGALDLQIGAALAGWGYALGYARLVEQLLGAALDKSETRSDWLRRPLSDAQVQYALDDVRYLHPLYDLIMDQLNEKGLARALAEESQQVAEEWRRQADPEHYFTRMRGAWRLQRHQQAILQRLAYWREVECRRRDRPRHRIVSDRGLLEMAQAGPSHLHQLAALPDVSPVVVRRYGERLLAEVEAAGASPAGQGVAPPLTKAQQPVYRRLKSLVASVAERHGIPPELLAPRRRLEQWVQQGLEQKGIPEAMTRGWRGRVLSGDQTELEVVFAHAEV